MSSVVALPFIDPLAELRKRFSLIILSGEICVVDQMQISGLTKGTLSGDLTIFDRTNAKLLLARFLETLPVPCDPKKIIADFWVDTRTHVYDATAFSPLPTPATTLNLWAPSPVLSKPGDWSIIGHYLLRRVCNGDRALLAYLLFYLAHMLQRPDEKPGVIIVLLGGEGTGKGTLFVLLRAIWPHTTLQVSNIEHVVGGFNASLERSYAVCLDEAIFKGDRRALDRMKSFITDSHVTIEQKYQPRRTIASFHRFFAASNHEHFAHTALDDRRFLYLRVAESQPNDHDYFAKLHAAISDPAVISAMVYDLQRLNLTNFNIRQRPRTEEHAAQKLRSLEGFDRYWYEVLGSGGFDPLGTGADPWSGARFVDTGALKSYSDAFNQSSRRYVSLSSQDISRSLKRWCPSASSNRGHAPRCVFCSGDRMSMIPVHSDQYPAHSHNLARLMATFDGLTCGARMVEFNG